MPIAKAKERLDIALTDSNVKKYLPKSPILVYSDLKHIQSVDELFSSFPYVVLLYEWKKNEGHWVGLGKLDDKIIYFDPYGYKVDYFLGQNTIETNRELGQNQRYLSNLFYMSPYPVRVNKVEYQNRRNLDLATCGRHIIWFGLNMLVRGFGLQEYHRMMKEIRKRTGLSYDVIVSYYIQ